MRRSTQVIALQVEIEQELAALDVLAANEPPWTEEETKLSLPYSFVRSWEWVLEAEHIIGRSNFNGPPGLKEKVIAQIDAEGMEFARRRHLQGVMANGEPYHPNPENDLRKL
jgi:hypothetical protein